MASAMMDNLVDLRINDQPIDAVTITEWQDVELSCVPPPGCTLDLVIGSPPPQQLEPFLHPDDPAWRWRWNPRNLVGHIPLTLRTMYAAGHSAEQRATLLVVPRKIDQERYELLIDDLQQVACGLIYALAGGTIGAATQSNDTSHERTLIETYFSLFAERFADVEQAVMLIARRPHTQLRPVAERVSIGQARDMSRVDDIVARGLVADDPVTPGHPPLPYEIVEPRSSVTADTYENQLLKRLLDELSRRARFIAGAAAQRIQGRRTSFGRSFQSPLEHIAERSTAIVQRLRELRALPFLAEVGALTSFHGPSQVMQRDRAYRQIYRMWQDLRRQPFVAIESPIFAIPITDMPRLYEQWCAVQLAHALVQLPGATVITQQLVTPAVVPGAPLEDSEQPYTITLSEDTPLLSLAWHDMRLTLRYQARYRPFMTTRSSQPKTQPGSLDRHTRVPDLVLEIVCPGQPPSLLICDAKYRLDAGGSVPEDALADAYVYLGSIGLASNERIVQAVMLLYPGQGVCEDYPSGVGAIPVLPGATTALYEWLTSTLQRGSGIRA